LTIRSTLEIAAIAAERAHRGLAAQPDCSSNQGRPIVELIGGSFLSLNFASDGA
jgi:hypothetical protein